MSNRKGNNIGLYPSAQKTRTKGKNHRIYFYSNGNQWKKKTRKRPRECSYILNYRQCTLQFHVVLLEQIMCITEEAHSSTQKGTWNSARKTLPVNRNAKVIISLLQNEIEGEMKFGRCCCCCYNHHITSHHNQTNDGITNTTSCHNFCQTKSPV